MPEVDKDIFADLIRSYDGAVEYRESAPVSDWKVDLRWKFLAALQKEGKTSLIDIGAGTGIHALFFQEQGLEVRCIDLSPALIEKCREKGLSSQLLSVLDLPDINQTFEAAFALNSLLHIPSNLLARALANIADVMDEGGLFYWGQYGGENREGVYQDDNYQPKRFFSLLTDELIENFAEANFFLEDFERIQLDDSSPLHFQSLLLRVKPSG